MEGRQVLLFDPAGNGRYAEVHGTLNANTLNIGAIVNGTTLSMDTVLRIRQARRRLPGGEPRS